MGHNDSSLRNSKGVNEMLRQDKKYKEVELVKLGKEINVMVNRLHKIDKDYFCQDYQQLIRKIAEMTEELESAIGRMKIYAS